MSTECIKLCEVTKTFIGENGNFDALKNINLSVDKGDVFGIIGLSGAGKSTLVRCINLLETPNSGQVFFDQTEMTALSDSALRQKRRKIGMIFQGFNLLMQKTSLDNVIFPLILCGVSKKKAKQKAMDLLKIVGLEDKMNAYPSQLSGGQKQRVAIARALATDPDVLLCDEATSALDPSTTHSILKLLSDINKNLKVTIIIITHEMRVIEEICNKVAIIENGEICEHGLTKDIFQNPQTKAAKKLVLGESNETIDNLDKHCIRLVFDGSSAYKPIISDLAITCNTSVSILFADMKTIDSKNFGQMIIKLPAENDKKQEIFEYLNSHNITYREEE